MLKKSLFKKPNISLEGMAVQEDAPIKCPSCKREMEETRIQENLQVCPLCGHHFRLGARERIAYLLDEGSFLERDANLLSGNPLSFPDYPQKLQIAMKKSGENEAVITGTGCIGGHKCAAFFMEPEFMMGSMGTIVGDKITRLFEFALENRLPVVGFTVSGGARMQEGILSLMQMAKVSGAVKLHSKAGLLYITVLTDPTTGGVTASFAMEGDIILAEPDALIGFAGPRVVEQTTHKKLPKGFQRAEMLLDKGFVDKIVPRTEQKKTLCWLLQVHEGGDMHAGL